MNIGELKALIDSQPDDREVILVRGRDVSRAKIVRVGFEVKLDPFEHVNHKVFIGDQASEEKMSDAIFDVFGVGILDMLDKGL